VRASVSLEKMTYEEKAGKNKLLFIVLFIQARRFDTPPRVFEIPEIAGTFSSHVLFTTTVFSSENERHVSGVICCWIDLY